MNILLIFFAFPIAVIIVSAILQKLLNSPLAVASLIFAIFLVITFAAFDETFLIATLAYTILAFITASLVRLFCRTCENNCICEALSNLINNNTGDSENNIATINNTLNEILNSINNTSNTNNTNNSNNSNNNNTCGCRCASRYTRFRRF